MVRFFAALTLFFSLSLACEGGFDACIAKVGATQSVQGQNLVIPLGAKRFLVYSPTPPKFGKILKKDSFLSLYLVEKKEDSKYFFKLNRHLSLGEACVNDTLAIEGRITQSQVGLNVLAKMNEPLFAPSLVLNSCCFLEGIVTHRGIIQRAYLKRFINEQESRYGDIGIRLDPKNKASVVSAIDPFFPSNPFEKGDTLLALDGKKVSSPSTAMETILFWKIGSEHRVEVARGSERLEFGVRVAERLGGGVLSDTFLESRGIVVNDALEIIEIGKNAASLGIAKGDRILGVNATFVKDPEGLRKNIYTKNKSVNLLLQRAGFQFFVQIN